MYPFPSTHPVTIQSYVMQKLFCALTLMILMAACAPKSRPAAHEQANSSLTNTRWKLTRLASLPNGLPPLPKDVFLQMDTGRIKGFGGCNSYFGGYTLSGNKLNFTGVASTKMFCQQTMDVEDKLFKVLNTTNQYQITGTKLELLQDKIVLATFEALYLQ